MENLDIECLIILPWYFRTLNGHLTQIVPSARRELQALKLPHGPVKCHYLNNLTWWSYRRLQAETLGKKNLEFGLRSGNIQTVGCIIDVIMGSLQNNSLCREFDPLYHSFFIECIA